jgi:hypothetical protein
MFANNPIIIVRYQQMWAAALARDVATYRAASDAWHARLRSSA